ncbi:MAG: endonuclease III [Alphaproteobacteria bacterium GM202ARS2]|nr:endonuclease III [Alphaproteobacteria bacterium GM202ARS2]
MSVNHHHKVLSKAAIERLFRLFEAAEPSPRGELHYTNAYTLLVAVVLSAQATDKGVNKATRPLFTSVDSPDKMVALGEDGLRDAIKTIGLFNTKARHIMALSRILLNAYDGRVPDSRAALESLPGVGRKTANVVLNIFFGKPTIAVDTHIFRVANRMGLAVGTTPLAVEKGLERCVPSWAQQRCHHWLILHGRYTCRAQKPLCGACLVRKECLWQNKQDEHNRIKT